MLLPSLSTNTTPTAKDFALQRKPLSLEAYVSGRIATFWHSRAWGVRQRSGESFLSATTTTWRTG